MTDTDSIENLRPDGEYWKFLWKSACKRAEEWETAWSQMEAERDALQAQLDNMTTEWGVAYEGFESAEAVMEIGYEDVARAHVGEGDVVVKRLVGPWVEVADR